MSEQQPAGAASNRVIFHYIKSNFFRVVHANGVHGGVSPKGEIQIAFFSERAPIPQRVTHEVAVNGVHATIGQEIESERIEKPGVIREVEVEVLLSGDTARSMYAWLGQHLEKLDKTTKQPDAPSTNG